jgi:2-dehydropantoate 2-reductase
MRIAMIGSGAMGSSLGGRLARIGEDVILYDRNEAHIAAIRRTGLTVTTPADSFTLKVPATTDIADVQDVDLAVVFVDGPSTKDVAGFLPKLLRQDGAALTMQNGIGNVEAVAAAIGLDRVLAGPTYCSAAMAEPGHALNTNIGDTVLGEATGILSERAKSLAALLTAAGFPTTAAANIMGHVWSKFVLNCALNPLAAISGLRSGEIARTPAMSALLDAITDEILAVVNAKGIAIPGPDPHRIIRDHAFLRYNRPSMLQHIEAKRTTERGSLNEALIREAEALGVAAPVNRTVVALIRGIEARHRREAATPVLDEAKLEALAHKEQRR